MTEQDLQTLVTYDPGARGRFVLLDEMRVERGTQADWDLLSSLHYKAHTLPVGAKHYRLDLRGETIGSLVFGMSRPLLKERHALFPLLRPGQDTQISNIARYAFVNDNCRVVGRMVVDTMFRSAGVAYRFLNLCCRMHGFRFLEIQSSMSKYNLFAQRAGFQMVKPIRSIHYDKGLKLMRRYFAAHPSDQEAVMDEFGAMSPAMQAKVERELKAFYYDHSPLEKTGSRRHYSEGVVENWDVRRTLGKIQGLCFASPLYGLYRNPDAGRELPASLPLLAFDRQLPSEPIVLGPAAAGVGNQDDGAALEAAALHGAGEPRGGAEPQAKPEPQGDKSGAQRGKRRRKVDEREQGEQLAQDVRGHG